MKTKPLYALMFLPLLFCCGGQAIVAPEQISISVPYDPDSMDPHDRNTISNYAIACHFYEGLVETDSDWNVKPALALSWENPDLNTWLFNLERSVTFHSGKEMDADDVVYSFRRLLADPALEMRGYLTNVIEVAALDRFRVRIRTKNPVTNLLNRISFVHIVPEGATSEMLKERESGTGPYRLAEWTKNERIRMVRNDKYWRNKASLKSVTYYLNRNAQQAMEDLRSGKSQLIQSNVKTLQLVARSFPRYETMLHDSIFVKFLAYDLVRDVIPYCSAKTNPFKNKLVRQAIDCAIDRNALVARLPTYAVPATQPVAPFVFGYNPNISQPVYDPARARYLLAQAGFPDGFAIVLHARKIFPEAASFIRDQLGKVGIRVDIKLLSVKEFYDAMNQKDVSFYFTGMGTPTGDATQLLEMTLHSPNPATNLGNLNFGGYSNPAIDMDIDRSSQILDMKKRRELLRNIMTHLMDDLPWIPLYSDQEAYAIDRSYSWSPRNDSYVFAYEIRPRTEE